MGIRGSRRRRKMTKQQDRKMEQPVTSFDGLSDDLLELVLLGLDWSVSLTRAAATCRRWRRIVADADGAFLRRFRSLHHAPPPVGHFYYAVDADPPCSFGIMCDGRQQPSLDFMPGVGDGKRQCAGWFYRYGDFTDPEIVVCEPLTRRYEKIALPWYSGCVMGAFLLDGDDDDEAGGAIGMDNFRVVLVLYDPERDNMDRRSDGLYRHGWAYSAVFSCSNNGIECAVGNADLDGVYLPNIEEVHLAGRTGGRLSAMAFPDHMTWGFHTTNFRVVGVDDDGRTVRIVCITSCGDLEVRSYTFHGGSSDESDGDNEWVVEKTVELEEASLHLPGRKEGYFHFLPEIITAMGDFVVLSPAEETWLFSVDLRTMELEREHERNRYKGAVYPCAPP
ncbi:unnamed protein product [Urochloa decumbens]|uniref:F-box domain-containing protein n=1 Tax=Urochloa decumbens TaxID=240449 RepID=A0ABC9FSF7_9POAL